MIRKIVLRLLLAGALLGAGVITLVTVVGLLAVSQPAFYSDLRAQSYTPAEQQDAENSLNQTMASLDRWLHTSIAIQKAKMRNNSSVMEQLLVSSYQPLDDTYTVRLTDKQLNAYLSTKQQGLPKQLHHFCIQFNDQHTNVGFELHNGGPVLTISASLNFVTEANGNLRIELLGGRLGRLPIPLQTIARWLPNEVTHASDRKLEFDLTATPPRVTLKLTQSKEASPRINSVQQVNGTLVVEFQAPTLNDNTNPQ